MTAASSQDRDAFADLQAASFRGVLNEFHRRVRQYSYQLEVWSGVPELGALCTMLLGTPTKRRYSKLARLSTPIWVAVPQPVLIDVTAVLWDMLGPPDLFWHQRIYYDLTWGVGDLRVTFT